MNSKERLLAAMRLEPVDRVPCYPNASYLVAAKRSGKPFWEASYYGTVDIDQINREMAAQFGYDLMIATNHKGLPNDTREIETNVIEKTDEHLKVERICRTKYGETNEITVYPKDTAPTIVKHHITDLENQIDHFLEWFPDPRGADFSHFADFQNLNDPYGISGIYIHIPGFQNWIWFIEGGINTLTELWVDEPELLERVREAQHKHYVGLCKEAIKQKPDFIFSSCSGLLTLQSPEIAREYSLPTLKEVTALAKSANIPTHLHSCGRSQWLVETFANETDLSSIEPLEEPTMGDIVLDEIIEECGDKICLVGNVHTIDVMQNGTPEDVRESVKRILKYAQKAKGFILCTADQCPPETSDENLQAFVDAAKEFGQR